MRTSWQRLKNAVEAAVTDLRYCLKYLAVPFDLDDSIAILEMDTRYMPHNMLAQDALVLTIRDVLDELNNRTYIADEYGYTDLRDRIASAVRTIRPALADYDN